MDPVIKNYRYTVSDVEHSGDYERFASAIIDGGGSITSISWSGEDGDDTIIRFTASTENIETIKSKIKELL